MMLRPLLSSVRCRRGTAAAEMALVTPLLLGLLFGSFELGNYFVSEHLVVKAVRDGARYAGRLPFGEYDCSTGPSTAARDQTRNVVRTGQVATGGTARLRDWSDETTITIAVACSAGTTGGIYKGVPGGAPVVSVDAAVPYSSLFGTLGLGDPGLTLNASSQASVNGV